MRVLATMPGRLGDILWALPTVRALGEAYGGLPIALGLSPKYQAVKDLVGMQPYVAERLIIAGWDVQETAPMTPRVPPEGVWGRGYDAVYHLGYEGWPSPMLAEDVFYRGLKQWTTAHMDALLGSCPPRGPRLDLDRPWITALTTVAARPDPTRPMVWVGWSEEWFELKVGLLVALAARFRDVNFWWLTPVGGRYLEVDRYVEELWVEPDHNRRYHRLGPNVHMVQAGWVQTAAIAAQADCYVGCLSSQWVLANGLGKPTVVVEPNSQRHHPVFYYDHARNHLVRGNDGLPTFDARHAGDVLQQVLEGVQRG